MPLAQWRPWIATVSTQNPRSSGLVLFHPSRWIDYDGMHRAVLSLTQTNFSVKSGYQMQTIAKRRNSASLDSNTNNSWKISPSATFGKGESSQASTNSSNPARSKRRQFRDISVPRSLLEYIESVGVGLPALPSRRREKPSRPRRLPRHSSGVAADKPVGADEGKDSTEEDSSTNNEWRFPPPPFGPNSRSVKVVATIDSLDEPDDIMRNGFPHQKKYHIAEVALIGRSNVGKSTLLNMLLYGNRKNPNEALERNRRNNLVVSNKIPKGAKAATSARPGETRVITVYHLEAEDEESVTTNNQTNPNRDESAENHSVNCPRQLRLVDLPGYGFAFASPANKERVRNLIESYLILNRQPGKASPLKRVLLLLDARHGMKQADFEFLASLQARLRSGSMGNIVAAATDSRRNRSKERHVPLELPPIQVVLTKCDLVSQLDLARRVMVVREQLSDALDRQSSQLPVMLVSDRSRFRARREQRNSHIRPSHHGIMELQRELAALCPIRKGRVTDRNSRSTVRGGRSVVGKQYAGRR